MSSTNRSLNPPSSIRVGDSDNHNDNNTSIGESKSPYVTEVKADATGTTATATIASPDIDSVIQGFQKELDSLSRSFDMMATSRSKRSEKSSTTPATNRHESSHSFSRFDSTPAASKSEFSAAPPPPPPMTQVAGKSDTDSRSTQKSNPRFAADETFVTATTTTRFDEPRPVETPVLSTGYSTTSHEYRRRRYADIDDFQDRNLFPSQTEKTRIQAMKEIMNEQSATILRLQRENNDLRKRLSQGMPQYSKQTSNRRDPPEPIFESSNRQKNSTPRTIHDHYSERNSYDPTPRTERNHHYTSSYYDDEMKPTVSSLTTIPRDDDDENTLETTPIPPSRTGHGFTPGIKFVAELSKFMTINQGHSVPLSVIIDRHWDKLKYHMRDEANADL